MQVRSNDHKHHERVALANKALPVARLTASAAETRE